METPRDPEGSPSLQEPPAMDWLGLAGAGSVVDAASSHHERRLCVTDQPLLFEHWLRNARPRIAIVTVPPARAADVELVIAERRRRTTFRSVHVSPPDAVAGRVAALEQGFDEAVPTDITSLELIARLELLDRRSRTAHAALLEIGDGVVIDLAAHEVRRDGAVVHLRPKEFQLLAMLAAHPGRAYTRRQVLDRVWGHDHDGDPRTVDVHVSWLRAKLERDPARPAHLVTVRGMGYRLDPTPR